MNYELVQRYKSQIPDKFYQIMIMSIEGSSYLEISRFIDIPIGTVKYRLNRGKALLAKLIENETAKN